MWEPAVVVVTARSKPLVALCDVEFSAMTESEVVEHVMTRLAGRDRAGRRGGWIVTPNADILRQAAAQPALCELLRSADLVVADGMPLVWASAIQGTRLPARVTGASLFETLSAAAAGHGHPVLVLGGRCGTSERAIEVLKRRYPGLHGDGWSPPQGIEATGSGLAEIAERIRHARAEIVFCGFGFPKQERLINELTSDFPDVWFLGCGAAVDFAAGNVSRAPIALQRMGFEWLYRLAREPRRLLVRYLVHDLPFVMRLLVRAALRRLARRFGR